MGASLELPQSLVVDRVAVAARWYAEPAETLPTRVALVGVRPRRGRTRHTKAALRRPVVLHIQAVLRQDSYQDAPEEEGAPMGSAAALVWGRPRRGCRVQGAEALRPVPVRSWERRSDAPYRSFGNGRTDASLR